jgi:hypothetical protein
VKFQTRTRRVPVGFVLVNTLSKFQTRTRRVPGSGAEWGRGTERLGTGAASCPLRCTAAASSRMRWGLGFPNGVPALHWAWAGRKLLGWAAGRFGLKSVGYFGCQVHSRVPNKTHARTRRCSGRVRVRPTDAKLHPDPHPLGRKPTGHPNLNCHP